MTETIIGKEGIGKEELREVITEGISNAINQYLIAFIIASVILFTAVHLLLPTK